MCPPGAHLPNRVIASRHSTGVTYSLARNSCLSTSMRLECAICGRGAEFPRASARRCLTFPHGVYSAHRFSSRSFFPLRPDVRDSPTAPRLTASCQGNCFIIGNCRPASIRFMVSVTRFFPLYWDEQHSISLNSAIYLRIYCRAKYFAREFILGQRAFRFSRKVAREEIFLLAFH